MVLPEFPTYPTRTDSCKDNLPVASDHVVSNNKGNLKDDNDPKYREDSTELPVGGAGTDNENVSNKPGGDAENNNEGWDERTAYGFGTILRDFFPPTSVAPNEKWVPLTVDEEWVPGRWVAVMRWKPTEHAYLVYRIPDQVLTHYSCQMLDTLNKMSGDISFHRPEHGFFPLIFWNPTYGFTKKGKVREQPHPWPCKTLLIMEDYLGGGKFMVEYSQLHKHQRLTDSEVRVLANYWMRKQSHLREDAVSKVNECWECEDGGELLICCGGKDVKGCGKGFHKGCVGLETVPHGNWICSECAGRHHYGQQGFAFPVASDSDDNNKRKTQEPPNNSSDKKAKNDNGSEHKDESTGDGGEDKAGLQNGTSSGGNDENNHGEESAGLPVNGTDSGNENGGNENGGNENGGNNPDGAGNPSAWDKFQKLLKKIKAQEGKLKDDEAAKYNDGDGVDVPIGKVAVKRGTPTKMVPVSVYKKVLDVAPDTSEPQCHLEHTTIKIPNKYKFLKFHEDCRPAYRGTWTKKSSVLTGRKPTRKDSSIFDYKHDSEAEWEDGDDERNMRFNRVVKEQHMHFNRVRIIGPGYGGVPLQSPKSITDYVQGFHKDEVPDVLSSYKAIQLSHQKLCLDKEAYYGPRAVPNEARSLPSDGEGGAGNVDESTEKGGEDKAGVENGTSAGNEDNKDGEESAGLPVASDHVVSNNKGNLKDDNDPKYRKGSAGLCVNSAGSGNENGANDRKSKHVWRSPMEMGVQNGGNVPSVHQMFTFKNFEWDDIYEQAHGDRNSTFSLEHVKDMWSFRVGSNAGMETVANIGEFKCSYKDSPRKALSLALWLGGTDLSGGGTQVYKGVHSRKPNRFELLTVDGVCLEEVQPTICTLSKLLSIGKNTTDKEWAKFPQILEVCSKTTRKEKKKGWEFLSAFVVYIPAIQWLFVVENDSEEVKLIALGTKTVNEPDKTINKKIGGMIFPAEGKNIDKRGLEVLQVQTVKWEISSV